MRRMVGLANNRGFTLIELLIVITILLILVGVVILAVGNVFGTARSTAYVSVRQQVQTAVVAYSTKHQGAYPLTGNTTVIDGNTLGIIDACGLLTGSGGMLRDVPDGFIATPDNDNCDSGEYNCSCDLKAHYIWTVDVNGNVYSLCVNNLLNGGGCTNNSSDGFQGIWP